MESVNGPAIHWNININRFNNLSKNPQPSSYINIPNCYCYTSFWLMWFVYLFSKTKYFEPDRILQIIVDQNQLKWISSGLIYIATSPDKITQ